MATKGRTTKRRALPQIDFATMCERQAASDQAWRMFRIQIAASVYDDLKPDLVALIVADLEGTKLAEWSTAEREASLRLVRDFNMPEVQDPESVRDFARQHGVWLRDNQPLDFEAANRIGDALKRALGLKTSVLRADTPKILSAATTPKNTLAQALVIAQLDGEKTGKSIEAVNAEFFVNHRKELGDTLAIREKQWVNVKKAAQRARGKLKPRP